MLIIDWHTFHLLCSHLDPWRLLYGVSLFMRMSLLLRWVSIVWWIVSRIIHWHVIFKTCGRCKPHIWHGQNVFINKIYWVKRSISIIAMATWMIENKPIILNLFRFTYNSAITWGDSIIGEQSMYHFFLPTFESQYLTQSLDFSIFLKPLQLYPAFGSHLPASITNGPPPPCEHFVHSPSLAFQFVSFTPRKLKASYKIMCIPQFICSTPPFNNY